MSVTSVDSQIILDPSMLDGAAAEAGAAAAVAAVAAAAAAGAPAAIAIDPAVLSALVATGCEAGVVPTLIGPDGQPIPAVTLDDEELQAQLAQLAATGVIPLDGQELLAHTVAAAQRNQAEAIRRGDMQAVQSAKRAGTLITLNFSLELPPELLFVLDSLEAHVGIVEVPASADVGQLKRLIFYASQHKLLPSMQELLSPTGALMVDADEAGNLVPISAYGISNESHITLRIPVPDEATCLSLMEEALAASAAYGTMAGAAPQYSDSTVVSLSRQASTGRTKTRWTGGQIEALVEGVERHGLSAWRTIVQDPRLDGKNNMQCKDKFRNLCLTIIQGRPERGLTLDYAMKERVRKLIEQENIRF